jgi:prolipoprotein diacylglyceryl transferase
MNLLIPLSIPSPSQGVWHIGPFPVRAYALAIILGVLAAVWVGEKRWVARGGKPGQIGDIALWAVPAGLIGARLYHVATDHDLYFGSGSPQRPIDALAVWHGGLGIWGAIAGGLIGAWLYTRRHNIRLRVLADALAPGLLLAQAIGRFGNYFNQELYGRPSDLPWAVKIDHPQLPYHEGQTFHPTFLYESLASLVVFGILLWFTRRYWREVPRGTVFALYATLYSFERIWVETFRIDPAHIYLGQRLNVWVASGVTVVAGIIFVLLFRRRRPSAPVPATAAPAPAGSAHTPTPRPEAAIAARLRTKRRRRN